MIAAQPSRDPTGDLTAGPVRAGREATEPAPQRAGHPQLPCAPLSAREQALARLQATRSELATELFPPPRPKLTGAHAAAGPMPRRVRALLRFWRSRWRGSPVLGLANEVARDWWQHSPLRPTAEWLSDQGHCHALPWIRRHPHLAIGATAGAAAALVVFRPWRHRWLQPHLAAWPRTARRWAWAQLRALPLQSLLGTALALWAAQHSAAAAGPAGPAAPPPARQPPRHTQPDADAPAVKA